MTLFAERVLPQLKALDVGTDIGRPASLPVDCLYSERAVNTRVAVQTLI
jgi:hypothetical protein